MATQLPTKLTKEPLIDAVFEVRFSSKVPASLVLPGFLFNNLDGEKAIEQLPITQFPKAVRDADPNLKFAPLSRVDWNHFFINVGDCSVSVSCKYPYPGWHSFKEAIAKVTGILAACKIVDAVERYSMKYVDIFPSSAYQQKFSMFNSTVSLAGHRLENEPFQLRIEIPSNGFIHAVLLASSAQAVLHNGVTMEGLIVDVDTFSGQANIPIEALLDKFSEKLDAIHQANKAMFFDCLTPETVLSLEPKYE